MRLGCRSSSSGPTRSSFKKSTGKSEDPARGWRRSGDKSRRDQRAERLVQEWLASAGWTDGDLVKRAKSDPQKIHWAQQMREKTPMTRQWIAERLVMGSASYVSHLTRPTNCRL